MAELWTEDRVLALAPDSSSAAAGQGLGSARKWVSLGRSGRAVWGECQGSGKTPYQTRVDLGVGEGSGGGAGGGGGGGVAFKCSCPSRKFPCKHALGLMLVLARDGKALKEVEDGGEVGWVAEWLVSRAEKGEKKAAKEEGGGGGGGSGGVKAPADPEARAKRAAKREEAVAAGLEGLDVWLRDLVRGGWRGWCGSWRR